MALNLAVLQRLDSKINQILATAGHVALYKFLPATQAWERKEVEGSLFVVERSEEPAHTIVVLNRISIENFCEPIIHGLQMRVSEPYLLLRNYKNETTGVWFYSKEEQHKISQTVRALLDAKPATKKTAKPQKTSADKEKSAAPSTGAQGPPGLSAPASQTATSSSSSSSPSASTSPTPTPTPTPTPVYTPLGSGGVPTYAQAVSKDSAAPAPAPTPAKPEHEPPRGPHGSNAAGAALLNLLNQPPADRERGAYENGVIGGVGVGGGGAGPVGFPHPQHPQHPHPHPHPGQPLQPGIPPHFPAAAQQHPMHPMAMHPRPHQPLLPHHPVLRQPAVPPPPPVVHHPNQSAAPGLASKQHLRAVLLSLVNDDGFIDMVYESYLHQLAAGHKSSSS